MIDFLHDMYYGDSAVIAWVITCTPIFIGIIFCVIGYFRQRKFKK